MRGRRGIRECPALQKGKEEEMPLVRVSGPALDVEKKRRLARGLTDVMCEVYERPAGQIIVEIGENPPENVAVGGKLIVDHRG